MANIATTLSTGSFVVLKSACRLFRSPERKAIDKPAMDAGKLRDFVFCQKGTSPNMDAAEVLSETFWNGPSGIRRQLQGGYHLQLN